MLLLTEIERIKDLWSKNTDEQDSLITRLLEQTTGTFAKFCNRHFERKERVEDYDARSGGTILPLRGYPVDKTKTFTIINDQTRNFNGSPFSDDVFHLNENNGLIRLDKVRWTGGPGVIRVTYTGGVAADTKDIFDDEKLVALSMAAELHVVSLLQRKDNLAMTSMSVEGGSIAMANPFTMLPEVKRILKQFKRRNFRMAGNSGG